MLSDVVKETLASKEKTRPVLRAGAETNNAEGGGFIALFEGGAALVAAFLGVLMAMSYLYVNSGSALEKLDQNVEQILTAGEGPAIRSVLILDKTLAHEVAKSFTSFSHIKSATVFDDHGLVLAQKVREQSGKGNASSIAGLFATAEEKTYSRVLKLPPGLANENARLQVTVNQKQGLSIVAGPTLSGIILFFLLGAFATFALVSGIAASKRKIHGYLVARFNCTRRECLSRIEGNPAS